MTYHLFSEILIKILPSVLAYLIVSASDFLHIISRKVLSFQAVLKVDLMIVVKTLMWGCSV